MITRQVLGRVWRGALWSVAHAAVLALAVGCSSEEKVVANDGLTVDPTSVPCQGAAWSDDVCIPGGEFIMGHKEIPYTPPSCAPGDTCGPGSPPATDYDPPHVVKLSPYFIDRNPATNAEYKQCFDAGMCPGDCWLLGTCGGTMYEQYRFTASDQGAYPVATIKVAGAEAYCQWRGKRLPTEAEWERAARGTKAFDYPWGNDAPDCTRYLCNPTDMPLSWSDYWLAPVGANLGDVSPEGVHEMVTSAMQILHDSYDPSYYQRTQDEDPQGPVPSSAYYRVARGDVTRRGRQGGYVVHNGITSPLPAWARGATSVGGVRCARSDDGASAAKEQFYRVRQRVLGGEHLTSKGGAQ